MLRSIPHGQVTEYLSVSIISTLIVDFDTPHFLCVRCKGLYQASFGHLFLLFT